MDLKRPASLITLATFALIGSMLTTATPAAAVDCVLPLNPSLVLNQSYSCTIPPGITAIKVELGSSAGGSFSAPAIVGGAGVAISVWASVTPGETLNYYRLNGSSNTNCGGGANNTQIAYPGSAIAVDLSGRNVPVVAGGGGAPGCGGDASGATGTGQGGDAGLPTGSGVAPGSPGTNGGSPSTGGGGGTVAQGTAGGGYQVSGTGASLVTPPGFLSYGGTSGNAGVKGGSGGNGYTGGGAGGGSTGTSGNIPDASGGGGGSSFLDPYWTLISASARSSTATSLTITDYTAISSNADLASLSASASTLSPSFASGTTFYTLDVGQDTSGTTVTPTVSESGATVSVEGSNVVSGNPSSNINLNVGITNIDVTVTAPNGTTIKSYTIQVTRAPPPPVAATGPTIEAVAQLTAANPISIPLIMRSDPANVAETLDGGESGLLSVRNPTDSGWVITSQAGTTSVDSRAHSGSPISLSATGEIQVPPSGTLEVTSSGYQRATVVYVFAIPRNQPISGSGTSGSVFLSAFTVAADGNVSGIITIPSNMNLGDFILQINGVSSNDQIRSLNIGMIISSQAAETTSGQLAEAAFFRPQSARFSINGERKLSELVQSLPVGSQVTQVIITAVTDSNHSNKNNLRLAIARANALIRFLNARDVGNSRNTLQFIAINVDGKERRYALTPKNEPVAVLPVENFAFSEPVKASSGKPLSTARVDYQIALQGDE